RLIVPYPENSSPADPEPDHQRLAVVAVGQEGKPRVFPRWPRPARHQPVGEGGFGRLWTTLVWPCAPSMRARELPLRRHGPMIPTQTPRGPSGWGAIMATAVQGPPSY